MIRVDDLGSLEPVRRLRGRNRTKADIAVYRRQGVSVALKDYGCRPFLIRQTLGRWLIRRESAAYRAAGELAGLPRFHGRSGPFALALEWVDARPLSSFGDQSPPAGWYERARAILARLHARGIAMGDLHHRDVLVSTDGEVYLVDLATAWTLGRRPGPLRRRLFERACELDELALARMQARLSGRDPDAVTRRRGEPIASWHRRGRRLKSVLARLSPPRATRGGRG